MQATQPTQPVSGPNLWTRADLAHRQDWRVTLSQTQQDQMADALALIEGVPFDAIVHDAVSLPAWQPVFDHAKTELIAGRGVVLIRGLDAGRYSHDQLRQIFWIVAKRLGRPMVQNAKGDLLGQVIDHGHDYDANNVRGYTTNRALAFHCDASEVVGLLCVHPAKSGGTSHICCAAAIHNELLAHEPQLLAPLYRGFHFDLRGEGDGKDDNTITQHRVPIFHYLDGRLSIRFNYKTIVDGMRKAGKPLTGIDLDAVDRVAELSRREDLVFDMDFQPGDMQWLSNHDVLHARGEFTDWDDEARKRRLLRIWLQMDDGRPLREAFSNRFNTGPKAGPAVVPGAGYWVRDA